jgi:hypothetical protein
MDVRERYGVPIRLGNVGRGITLLAGLLFVAGWVVSVWVTLTSNDDIPISSYKAQQIIQLGTWVTLGASALALVGIAMRAFGIWLEARVVRGTT